MLLKYSQAQKRVKLTPTGKPQRPTGIMKLTSTMMNVVPRIHRKVIKNVASKRPNSAHHRIPAASKRQELRPITVPIDPCDNSNDSGLGFDQHIDYPLPLQQPVLRLSDQEVCYSDGLPSLKRQRIDIKLESDDANDNFAFRRNLPQGQATNLTLCLPTRAVVSSPPSLVTQLSSLSRDGRVQLQIVCQPEQQHRARYQTEGSRGAVKDRSGNGFPIVKLVGYDKPAVIQVFIGTDQGRVVPHMFYQACRVSGKNSTPCVEKKIDGTVVIEVETVPDRDMSVTCDCVGILKERNVDVEHRFPEESPGRSKKKSTRCRMVFRTCIVLNDGTTETLQVTSQPIVCTQPPGIPEIAKKSLVACPATGGLELFVLGKNFLKDTKVVFEHDEGDDHWEAVVQPDKEFMQQSHLVCVIPPFKHQDIVTPVTVRLVITSSGKSCEPHDFTYTPPTSYYNLFPVPMHLPQSVSAVSHDDSIRSSTTGFSGINEVHPVMLWPSPLATKQPSSTSTVADEEMPPPPPLLSLTVRRPSVSLIVPETVTREEMKQETIETPQTATDVPKSTSETVADLSTTHSPSMAALRQFVSETPSLPSISVENYLNGIETNVATFAQKEAEKSENIINTATSSAAQLHSSTLLSECNTVSSLVHSQIINEMSQQSSQLHSPPIISEHNSVTNLVQPSIMSDIAPQPIKSQLHSPPIMSSCDTVTDSIKQSRYSGSLLPGAMETAPLSSSLLLGSENTMQFTQSIEANESTTRCLNEILSPRNAPSELQPSTSSLISEPQGVRLSDLVSTSIVQPSTTDRLDAFVNSAADSHISSGQSTLPMQVHLSTISSNRSQSMESQNMSPLLQGVQNSCPNKSVVNTSLCSLLTGPQMSRLEQPAQVAITQSILPSLTTPREITELIVSQSMSPEILTSNVSMVQSNMSAASHFAERQNFQPQSLPTNLMRDVEQVKSEVKEEFMMMEMSATQCTVPSTIQQTSTPVLTSTVTVSAVQDTQIPAVKKNEEGMSLGSGIQELTQMSEHDLISYINPSYFDKV